MSNRRTIETYNKGVQQYIDGTPQVVDGSVKEWIDTLLKDANNEARILEVGSAFGRNADYIESLGYSVMRTDASSGFVEYLHSMGKEADLLNVLTDTIGDELYDVIFVDAVFLHFNQEEFMTGLRNAHSALVPGGKLGLTLKKGDGEEFFRHKMNDDRYFKYWQKPELVNALSAAAFKKVSISEVIDNKWLHIIAEKEVGVEYES